MDLRLVQCLAKVADGGPTLYQHCCNVSCLLGMVHERATGPDGSFNPVLARNSEVLGSNPDRACACTVHVQAVQIHGVYSAAYGSVHYKEPLKSFDRSRA